MLRWILCWMNERYACILHSLHPVELLGRVLHVRITKGYSATTDLELWFISFTWLVVCGLLWLSLMVRLIFHNLTCHWFKSWTHITLLGPYDMVFFSKWRWLIQHLQLTPIDFLWWPIHQQWLSISIDDGEACYQMDGHGWLSLIYLLINIGLCSGLTHLVVHSCRVNTLPPLANARGETLLVWAWYYSFCKGGPT